MRAVQSSHISVTWKQRRHKTKAQNTKRELKKGTRTYKKRKKELKKKVIMNERERKKKGKEKYNKENGKNG
jgi:hypothetical protein